MYLVWDTVGQLSSVFRKKENLLIPLTWPKLGTSVLHMERITPSESALLILMAGITVGCVVIVAVFDPALLNGLRLVWDGTLNLLVSVSSWVRETLTSFWLWVLR